MVARPNRRDLPGHLGTNVLEVRKKWGAVSLRLGATEQRNERLVVVHSVIADHGYGIDIAPLLP